MFKAIGNGLLVGVILFGLAMTIIAVWIWGQG